MSAGGGPAFQSGPTPPISFRGIPACADCEEDGEGSCGLPPSLATIASKKRASRLVRVRSQPER
jgi:hypothetical protein